MAITINTQNISIAVSAMNKELARARASGGPKEVRSHYRWLLSWAADPEVGRIVARKMTFPPHPDGGHWAREGLEAAATLVEAGLLRGRKAPWGWPV